MSVWKLADAESVAHSVAESSIPSLDVYEDPMHPFGGWGRGLGGVQPHGSSHHKGSKFTKRGFEYAVPETRGKTLEQILQEHFEHSATGTSSVFTLELVNQRDHGL